MVQRKAADADKGADDEAHPVGGGMVAADVDADGQKGNEPKEHHASLVQRQGKGEQKNVADTFTDEAFHAVDVYGAALFAGSVFHKDINKFNSKFVDHNLFPFSTQ